MPFERMDSGQGLHRRVVQPLFHLPALRRPGTQAHRPQDRVQRALLPIGPTIARAGRRSANCSRDYGWTSRAGCCSTRRRSAITNSTPCGRSSATTPRRSRSSTPTSPTTSVLGHPNVAFADIQWAMETAGLRDWISEQPDGYESILVAEGLDLPRSVRVRLLIARGHRPAGPAC